MKKHTRKVDEEMLSLIREYEEVAAEIGPLAKKKDEVWGAIKELMGETEEKIVPGFGKVTYTYDKDKTVTTFDSESFKAEQPKLYKKYVKEEVKKGARRLQLKGMED